jgi:TRAP-type mannitol/chloroaromatic compound transport system substrate-binding protein
MRRRFLIQRGGIAGVLAAGIAPAVHAQAAARWRLASSFAPPFDILLGAAQSFARKVGEMSGGRFQIDVHAAGELMSPLGVLDGVERGAIEACHTSGANFFAKNPAFAFGAAIPFGMNVRQLAAWMNEGNGLKLTREFHAGFNAINFPCGSAGAQQLGWFRKEISDVQDFRGLKVRTGGLAGRVFARLGASPQEPAGGAVGAAIGTSPYDDQKSGVAKGARHAYFPGWWAGALQLDLLVNQKAFDALSADHKAIVQAASASVNSEVLAKYDARNPAAIRQLTGAGALFKPFPRRVIDAAFKASMDVCSELSGSDAFWKKIHSDYRAFQKEQLFGDRILASPFDTYMQSAKL